MPDFAHPTRDEGKALLPPNVVLMKKIKDEKSEMGLKPLKIAASNPEARDEGPRLIPLPNFPLEPATGRYLELADDFLRGGKRKK